MSQQPTIDDVAQALEGVLAHYWDGRKRDVRKQFSAMVAEAEARKVLDALRNRRAGQ